MPGPIVITGGGTGGHVFPMQAIAEQLQVDGVEMADLRFVGSRRGQESTLLKTSGVALTLLPGRGLQRSFRPAAVLQNAAAVVGLVTAVVLATMKVAKWRPSVVVSVGGYASFAVALAAVLWRRPLVLIELDATPGAAHRLLGRFARARCCAFSSTQRNAVVTGAPLRQSILTIDRSIEARRSARAMAAPPIDEDRLVVVVVTGSLGSTRVNRAVVELAERWRDRRDRTLIHVTGRRDYHATTQSRPVTNGLDYRIEEFGDMTELWGLCDVAVCRAGATTVAEQTTLAIASILVPLPGMGDHQTLNALSVVEAGGARLIVDADCNGESLEDALNFVATPDTLAAMARSAGSIGRRDAAHAIAKVVREVGGWS